MGIEYEKADGVAVITIRNGSVNPFTPDMHRELHTVMTEFLGDPEVRVGVMRGHGLRAFSAGDDVKSESPPVDDAVAELLSELTPQHRRGAGTTAWEWSRDTMMLERRKPVVASVEGWCLGQGMAYLLALTDIRIASTTARFGFPEIAYTMAGLGATTRLARRLPRTVAAQMLLTGDPIDADEAHRVDLVNEVVVEGAAFDRAYGVATRIAQHSALALRVEMEAIDVGERFGPEDAVRYGERLYQLQRLAIGESESDSFHSATRSNGSATTEDGR
jgi:enoyl-CoA hydratase/carnithine racemase